MYSVSTSQTVGTYSQSFIDCHHQTYTKEYLCMAPNFLCHTPQNITLTEVQYFTTKHNFRTLHLEPKCFMAIMLLLLTVQN